MKSKEAAKTIPLKVVRKGTNRTRMHSSSVCSMTTGVPGAAQKAHARKD